ncbi:MAG TPA: DUF1648 domain-containing protein, partial [Candidatus Scatomorpha intestinigallinarum]|nr:DUF1648 domain-containing protein [Candidatus Scatomorpha intestinigallinarum]
MGRLSKRDALLLEALFCALPLVYYLLRLPSMPETVPVHWNAAGEATRYAARFSFDTILSSVSCRRSLRASAACFSQ